MAAASSTSVRLLALGLAVAALGCNKSEAAASGRAPSGEATPIVKGDSSAFAADIRASGPYTAGAEGTVEVSLTPKAGYHVNAEYPYKFKLDPAPDGVTYPKPLLVQTDGVFAATKGTFLVPFVAAKAGKYTLSGILNLSVCSEENCVIQKAPLHVDVDVK